MTKFYSFWILLFISVETICTKIPTLQNKPLPNHIKCSLMAYGSMPYPISPSNFSREQQKMEKEIEDIVKPMTRAINNFWEDMIQIPKVKEILNTMTFQEIIDYVECPEDVKRALEPMAKNFPHKPTFFHREGFCNCEVIEKKEGSIKLIIDATFFKKHQNNLAWPVIFEHENGHVQLGHRDASVCNTLKFVKCIYSHFDAKIEAGLGQALIELYHCREKQADIFALTQPGITLRHMIAFKKFFEKQNMQSSLTHPSSADRVQYIDRLITAHTKDLERNDASLD